MTPELDVLLGDAAVGSLRREPKGALAFVYDETWRSNPNAYPLSTAMPLASAEHRGDGLAAYLWGLLPDNDMILEAWASRFHVSARNPFGLLAYVGEDCPGAVRFVRPARRHKVAKEERGSVQWLDEHAIAERLRALHRDESAWRTASDAGQFSLGGAQPKTALYFNGTRWGVPTGRLPTTHILKPGSKRLDGHAENEHFCLALARELGLPSATSSIVHFENEVAICVERYDRLRKNRATAVVRVHQEDFCQPLGVLPVNKYENAGGPGVYAIARLLRERSHRAQEDVATFVDALVFNWVIAGTDAHAKNYSVLIGRGGTIRLAPLYDVASFLPYAEHQRRKLKLAMKIGGKYRIHDIGLYAWQKLAIELGLDKEALRSRVFAMCTELPDLAAQVFAAATADGLFHPGIARLAEEVQGRARACTKAMRLGDGET